MGNETSQKEPLSLKEAYFVGGGAIFWGVIGIFSSLPPLFIVVMRTMQIGTSLGDYFTLAYMLMHLFAFVGLVLIGLFVIYRSRYVLFILIPFSIIGLMTIPTGTAVYITLLRGLWKFMPLYFPFDKK